GDREAAQEGAGFVKISAAGTSGCGLASAGEQSFFRSTVSHAAATPTKRPLSLGVIFLTLYIDLIGFSIGFPFGPDLLDYYLKLEGKTGLLGWLVTQSDALAHAFGIGNYAPILFGGAITSVFSILQFVFAPFWGAISDRRGRHGVLMLTVA